MIDPQKLIEAAEHHIKRGDSMSMDPRVVKELAQAAAANEQMLKALKLYLAHAGEPGCAIWRHVHSQINAAIAAAKAARGG